MFFKIKKKKGFTLVEILVSISILVTILAIVTKLLFDFSRSAYRISFQIKNTETIRNIFRKLEYTFIRSRAVIHKYEIERARPLTLSINELKGYCGNPTNATSYTSVSCMETPAFNAASFSTGLKILRSGKDMLILSAPVFSKSPLDAIDKIDTAQSGMIETISGIGGLASIYGYYPYNELPTHGDYLTSDPLDVDQPPGIGPAYTTASKNDVFILYRDGEKNLRMYQLPSLAVVPNGSTNHQGTPYSRYQDGFLPDGTTPKYSYKGNILGVKLASGIEKTITTFNNAGGRIETPYTIFSYYTPTKELKFEDDGITNPFAKNVSAKLKSATVEEKKEIGQVTAVRIKLNKSSDYDVRFVDNFTSGIYEPTQYKKRIDEKTKETLFRLNRVDTLN